MREGDRLPQFPWLNQRYSMDESDWIVLAPETWEALAMGDEPLWEDLERKLLMVYYQHKPEVIAVVGHADGDERPVASDAGRDQVQRIAARIRGCNLPVEVLGFWSAPTGEEGELVVPTIAEREEQYALWY
jgi:hypothetical protein